MLKRIFDIELNAELVAALIFMIISGLYIAVRYNLEKVYDTLFLWMFPASVMIFLTLLIVKIIEMVSQRRNSRNRYIPLG